MKIGNTAKEILADSFPIIEKFAPGIAGAIGGPIGFAAGYLIPLLANAFGTHPTDLKGLVANIISDPNAQTKLQQIESEHGAFLMSLIGTDNKLTGAEFNVKLQWANSST